MARHRLPTDSECRAGIPLALANADAHLAAADRLAAGEQFGFAIAHLVYALEEGEKARTLGKVALGDAVPAAELHGALYEHRPRHVGAMTKSWTSGAIRLVTDFEKERLWEKLGKIPPKTEEGRWAQVLARHPEVLPLDWAENAGSIRERSLYVDMGNHGWTTPSETPASEFERVRPAVGRHLLYLRAAYERQIVASEGQSA